MKQPIHIVKPCLPPLEKYEHYLKRLWQNRKLTNNGELVQELEKSLKEYLNVKHLILVSNGTIALQLALRALNVNGDVITTPFSFIASLSGLLWENCNPVFGDIDQESLCLSPSSIEFNINNNTKAIMPVHVYGIPCDVESIAEIAGNRNIPVIYDAAHCFKVEYKGKPILNFGNISTLSFNATKLFHTVEGGAIITNDDTLAHKVTALRNYGIIKDNFYEVGINAKMSEFHAAMGLSLLDTVEENISRNKKISIQYDEMLLGEQIRKPNFPSVASGNYSFYPIIFNKEAALHNAMNKLNENNIFPKRYFHPSLSSLKNFNGHSPIADDISSRVLCLPMYPELSSDEVAQISKIVLSVLDS